MIYIEYNPLIYNMLSLEPKQPKQTGRTRPVCFGVYMYITYSRARETSLNWPLTSTFKRIGSPQITRKTSATDDPDRAEHCPFPGWFSRGPERGRGLDEGSSAVPSRHVFFRLSWFQNTMLSSKLSLFSLFLGLYKGIRKSALVPV